jgi:CelD/BcsL family acetyltransferase involved in cellulose biosynthesis
VITAQIAWDLRQLGPVADEWAALDGLGRCEPFTSLAWTQALLAAHVDQSETAFAVVLRSNGEALAIIPAVIRTERLLGSLDIATLYLLCDLTTSHSDILRSSDQEGIITAFFESIAALPTRWDILRISRFLEGATMLGQMSDYLASSGLAHRIRREQPSFVLDLAQSYDQFLAARSGKFRNYLRRKARQLEAAGRIEVRRAGQDLSVGEAYDHLLTVEQRSWKQAHGTAISAVPRQREFYRTLCLGAARAGRLHLMLMYLDDTPIAFNLGITAADRYSYLKTSFDETFRTLSPATVLRSRLVETLITEGFRSLDFPAEPYQWEEQWTDELRWHSSVVVFNRTPRATLYRGLMGLRKLSRRSRDDDDMVRYIDPRDHRPGTV